MRLISQDGKGDMPYENFIFRVHGGDIVASRDILIDKKPIVAKYSTEAKALKAMEMLRSQYQRIWEIENGFITPGIINNHIFVFPQDKEVEV